MLNKIGIITKLREQLLNFHKHLKTEEKMSSLYERMLRTTEDSTTE